MFFRLQSRLLVEIEHMGSIEQIVDRMEPLRGERKVRLTFEGGRVIEHGHDGFEREEEIILGRFFV